MDLHRTDKKEQKPHRGWTQCGRCVLLPLQLVGGLVQPAALEGFDVPGVGESGQGRIDGHLRQHGQVMALRGLGGLALAEEVDLLPAVRAGDIAHVLHQAHDGDLHHLRHLDGLLHHHAHQLLGGGHDDDAVQGNGLEHAEGHVAGSRRHIHEQIVAVPQHVGPELLDHAGDDRAPPDDRVRLVGQQQVGAHHLDAGLGDHGIQARLAAHGLAVDTEGLGDGGTGDVGIQNADLMAPAAHGDRQLAGDHGLADAALAGHDAEHLADVGFGMVLLQQGLGLLPLAAALAAGGAVMGAFAHNTDISFFRFRVIKQGCRHLRTFLF